MKIRVAVILIAISLVMPFASPAHLIFIVPVEAQITPYGPGSVGEQRVIVILVEFTDVKHRRDASYFRNSVFSDLDRYYRDVSFGATWLTVTVYDRWYQLSGPISKYAWDRRTSLGTYFQPFLTEVLGMADIDIDFAKYNRLIIFHAGTWAQFGEVSFVTYGAGFRTNDGVTINHVQVDSEDDGWIGVAHEFGHNIGRLPDLYGITTDASGRQVWDSTKYVGPWDVMSNDYRYPTPTFAAWNKIRLGWLQNKNVMTGRELLADLEPLAAKSEGFQAIKIPLTGSKYYLVEVRLKIGFYDVTLPDSGVLVSIVDETKGGGEGPLIIVNPYPQQQRRFPVDDSTFDVREGKNPAFFDESSDIGIVVLVRLGSSYRVAVNSVAKARLILKDGETAFAAMKAIEEAKTAITAAENDGRTEGLDQAKQLLQQAEAALRAGNYERASDLATRAKEAALRADFPRAYYEAKELFTKLEREIKDARFQSTEANELWQQAANAWNNAMKAFAKKDWLLALTEVKNAVALLDRAKSAEEAYQSRQTMLVIGGVAAGVAIASLAIVILLKRRRSGPHPNKAI